MKRLLSDPRLYVAWAVLVVAALYAAYRTDPYIFGFAAFALAGVSGLIAVAGALFVVLRPGSSRSDRLVVLAALLLSGIAVLRALALLKTFRWA